jgi:hypothetical protein
MVEAPLAQDAVGRNPTDRGKKGTKRSLAVESHGLPVGIVLDGTNRHRERIGRWVVEVCHSWLNRFRKLLVRYEKKVRNYRRWWSSPVRLFFGEIVSRSIQALFPDVLNVLLN